MQANQRPVGVRNDPFANSVHIPGIGGGKTFFFRGDGLFLWLWAWLLTIFKSLTRSKNNF